MPHKLEDYEVLSIIGRGSFGTCYNVRNRFTRELFAMKAVDYGNLSENHKELLVSEVNLLRSLSHPNIVRYCGKILHKETTTLYIITEWCEGGDLSKLIKNTKDNNKYIKEQLIWQMLYQISKAIQVCHSRMRNFTIFHRDIKPANVFLDCHGNAKLGDFGLARIVRPDKEYSETFVGTPYYMSPELIKGHKYNRKSDIWALGCLIYELCALIPPFSGCNMSDLANIIRIGKYNSIPPHYSEDMKKVISFMLSKRHEFRPTIEMILHHPTVVSNIVPNNREYSSSRQSGQSKSSNDEDCHLVNCTVETEMINSTLVEPELVSNKVFKDKWIEKHEALKEKEAWLRKREQNIGDREKSLASREKKLLIMERQARQKQFLLELQQKPKKKEMPICEPHQSDHETDVSVEPGDTPIRTTSTRLDPVRLPRPDILIKACKKLEQLDRKTTVKQVSFEQPTLEKCVIDAREISKVRRSLILTENMKNTVLKDTDNLTGRVLKPLPQMRQQSKSVVRDNEDKQKMSRGSMVKILKKEANHKRRRDKENVAQVIRIDNLKIRPFEPNGRDNLIHAIL